MCLSGVPLLNDKERVQLCVLMYEVFLSDAPHQHDERKMKVLVLTMRRISVGLSLVPVGEDEPVSADTSVCLLVVPVEGGEGIRSLCQQTEAKRTSRRT